MAAANTQFSIALHIMACLGSDENTSRSSAYLAGSINATPSFVRRILAMLSKAGLVHTVRGPSGSCSLTRKASEITLLDIYRAVDAPKVFALHQYPPEKRCTISCRMKHALTEVLDEAQAGMEQSLQEKSLADFLKSLGQD